MFSPATQLFGQHDGIGVHARHVAPDGWEPVPVRSESLTSPDERSGLGTPSSPSLVGMMNLGLSRPTFPKLRSARWHGKAQELGRAQSGGQRANTIAGMPQTNEFNASPITNAARRCRLPNFQIHGIRSNHLARSARKARKGPLSWLEV